ncbi:MAG: DUF4830 domain-containing protein [Eubacterium sp.]|nr:DUF4830 domain-containing protein [Eubacterium sp.]MBR4240965.1 DUF4830 domain-containing protein [Eubacterium sp.]MBR7060581.1 DUF4830 domain-containing protein [Eubacterium sp.]
MQVITFKAKPKAIFGAILALTGIIVILLTFLSNHSKKAETASASPVKCETSEQRADYLSSLGWEWSSESEKQIIIPERFNEVYENYNNALKKSGFNLEKYKGKSATLYTYNITNHPSEDDIIADLIVSNGVLIGADLCNPSADHGFLKGLEKNDTAS